MQGTGNVAAFRFLFAVTACVVGSLVLAAAPASAQEDNTTPSIPVANTAPTSPGVQALPGLGKSYALLEIDGDLMSKHGTVVLKRGIDFAVRKDVDLIVLYLRTPGGLLPVMFVMMSPQILLLGMTMTLLSKVVIVVDTRFMD